MIYIVRHGQTDYNLEGKITGRRDIPLNSQGIKEAYTLRKKLKNINFDYVFVSPLKRTIETARLIVDNDLIIDNRIIERSNGELEGKNKNEIPIDVNFNLYDKSQYGLEPINEIRMRVKSFLDEILTEYEKKNVLIVTHGGVIINMRVYFEGEPKSKDYGDYIIKNCDVITYDN